MKTVETRERGSAWQHQGAAMKKGWKVKRLGELGAAIREQAKIVADKEYELWSVPSFATGTPETSFGKDIGSAKLLVRPDDVLICKINPRINRVWLVSEPINGREQIGSTEWLVFRANPDAGLSPTWLIHFVSAPKFREWMESEVTGATGSHTRAKADGILRQQIPVPPLAEQQRIVGLLDEAFEGLATAKANCEANLQNARALFESHLQSVLTQRGPGWVEKTLGALCDIKHGFAFKGEFFSNRGDYVVLTPGNYYETGGYRDRGERQKYYVGEIPPAYIMKKGDMLVAMTEQAAGLLGSPLLVPESGRFLHNQRLGLVSAKSGVPWTNEFFFHVFNTQAVRKAIHNSASGVKVRHTSPTKIGEVFVCFPTSIEEQKAIVAVFADLHNKTQHLTSIYSRKLAALDALKKSLLHQAFSGAL